MARTAIACKQQTVTASRYADSLRLARCSRSSTTDECIGRREERQVSGRALCLYCQYVCLFVRLHISKTTRHDIRLTVAVARGCMTSQDFAKLQNPQANSVVSDCILFRFSGRRRVFTSRSQWVKIEHSYVSSNSLDGSIGGEVSVYDCSLVRFIIFLHFAEMNYIQTGNSDVTLVVVRTEVSLLVLNVGYGDWSSRQADGNYLHTSADRSEHNGWRQKQNDSEINISGPKERPWQSMAIVCLIGTSKRCRK